MWKRSVGHVAIAAPPGRVSGARGHGRGDSGDDDRFLFVNVSPGRYSVHIGTLGIFPPDPIVVDLAEGDTAEVEIVARYEDALEACTSFS